MRDTWHRRPSGLFEISIFRSGKLVDQMREPNLVVDLAKTALSRLLGGDTASRSVTQIGVGTSGTAPAAGNTSLTAQALKTLDGVTYPDTASVRFAFSLGAGEMNGMAILEFGLFTAGSILIARKTRASALNKASDITVSGTWTLTF